MSSGETRNRGRIEPFLTRWRLWSAAVVLLSVGAVGVLARACANAGERERAVGLLACAGLTLGEMFVLDALAADCAADGVWECLLAAPPLRVTGGVGSPVNPLAVK